MPSILVHAHLQLIARVQTLVYGNIFIWKEPFQASLEKHVEAYEEGTLAGDIEYGLLSLVQMSCTALWACGQHLPTLEEKM